ncbi:hypothetical protein GDO81_005353 [Engystomops pustulosus]|uniref:Fibronectin type-III domain-containing protein n=1 Tax=Engystomops pustulosus TaxID=76066 RepID=A0AAV7CNE2_ENGPU|nr:hypothetical protein GDO81_005353 [Engystomops pustulosus]
MLYNTIVTSESATIRTLTPGETYTFLVYTRAADGKTESDPMSYAVCFAPAQFVPSLNKSVNVLGVTWQWQDNSVDNYIVIIKDSQKTNITTITTNTTQVTITGLLPGREYSVTLQTNSLTCSWGSILTAATYPTDVRNISFQTIGTNNMTLSWMEPVNMTGVDKTYNIRYGNSSGTWTVTSNTTSVTLQDLTSGTNYTITVVTVGVRGYQSSPVSTSVYTSRLLSTYTMGLIY